MIDARRLRKLDWPLVVAVFALVAFSWPYVKSASYRSGPEGEGHYTSSPQRQIVWVGISVVLAAFLLVPNYRTLAETSRVLYLGGLATLVAVLLVGRTINGAKSWIVLSSSLRVQPSEFVKITTILALAQYMSSRERMRRMGHLVSALVLAAVPAALIAVQPDLGSALMFVPAAVAMAFIAGARLKHLGLLALIALLLLPVGWMGLNLTQRARILTWLEQGRELTRAERIGRFHDLLQAKTAIGSGGLWGRGIGEGTQNRLNYIGFRNTDFIFAVICEEGGFLGANVVIVLYLVLAGVGLGIARRCREPAGRLIAVGVVALFACQGFVNIAMAVGLLPIVGVTLPFVSYGGSSMMASFLGISLLLNVGLRRPTITFAREELGLAEGSVRGRL